MIRQSNPVDQGCLQSAQRWLFIILPSLCVSSRTSALVTSDLAPPQNLYHQPSPSCTSIVPSITTFPPILLARHSDDWHLKFCKLGVIAKVDCRCQTGKLHPSRAVSDTMFKIPCQLSSVLDFHLQTRTSVLSMSVPREAHRHLDGYMCRVLFWIPHHALDRICFL